jgi:hypothetical protein
VPKTPSRAPDGVACAEAGSVTGTTDGVAEEGTDGLTVDAAGTVTGDATGSIPGRLVPVLVLVLVLVPVLLAGASVAVPPLSVVGFVAAATGAAMLDTVCAAVAESVPPPPPQAASDVHIRVETTLMVTVREKSVIWVSSISGSIGCGIRLFALSLLDDIDITLRKIIPHGKKDFYRKILGIRNRRLPVLL